MSYKEKTVDLNFKLSESDYCKLKLMCKKHNLEIHEFFQQSTKVFEFLHILKDQGKKIYYGNEKICEKEIII